MREIIHRIDVDDEDLRRIGTLSIEPDSSEEEDEANAYEDRWRLTWCFFALVALIVLLLHPKVQPFIGPAFEGFARLSHS